MYMAKSKINSNKNVEDVLFDTNILLLWIVGSVSRNLILEHKRTRNYAPDHYDTLINFKRRERFRRIIVTPHILAECSNLARQTTEPQRTRISQKFSEICGTSQEIYTVATTVIQNSSFQKLGLTDSGILETLDQHRLFLLTADLDLFIAAYKRGHRAANFNRLI
jgi:hypothetical protein